jgi:HK97 family phage major capsid protein
MKAKFKVLSTFKDHTPGEVLELSEEEAKPLLELDLIEEVNPEKAAKDVVMKEFTTSIKTMVTDSIKSVMSELVIDTPGDAKIKLHVGQERELLDPKEGYDCSGSFVQDVFHSKNGTTPNERLKSYMDRKLARLTDLATKAGSPSGQSESIGEDGGILVPDDFSNELLRKTFDENDLLSRVKKFPTKHNSLDFKTVIETSRATGSRHGAIRSYWMDEAEQYTSSKVKFGTLSMKLHKLGSLVYMTDELLSDSPFALTAFLSDMVSKEMAFMIGDAIIRGNGIAKPLGILDAGNKSKIEITKETSQVAKTIVAENIDKMWQRMPAYLRKNAIWLINQDAEAALNKLHYEFLVIESAANVGGYGFPLYIPPGGISNNPSGVLKGRPVIVSEFCETLGTAGDLILANLDEYLMLTKGGITSAMSIHLRFDYDEQVMKFMYRIDGEPWWNAPLTPYKGTDTLSPFLTIAVRA